MTDAWPDHSADLESLIGLPTGPPALSPDAVNLPMIRHWVEAMGDTDPVYVSDAAARAVGLESLVAPPTMLQAWTMRGLRATLEVEQARIDGSAAGASAHDRMMALFDAEGMTSVVATNCEQTYARPLRIGDRVIASSVIESISAPKQTALGVGRFATTRTDLVAVPDASVGHHPDTDALFATGEAVATMRFRILKYRPAVAVPDAGARDEPALPPPRRPRPALTEDIEFWFEGARRHRLLIQRCSRCHELRHPPLPSCPSCRSFDWDAVESTGRGTLYSFVVVHYPQVPGFEYPLAIGLVELEEGTRLVADLRGLGATAWRVGQAVEVEFVDHDDELTLPAFRPVDPTGAR
ncbi:MAG: OB-fold domain-containing protein [Actinomycetota bacterium]|jgi:uncharacterized OB-fold protein|nr:OB-fold domain-containing protein [Actinomycetota bacterium]